MSSRLLRWHRHSCLCPIDSNASTFGTGKSACATAGNYVEQGVKMKEARKYAVVFEKSPTGYGAYVPDLPGCVSVGDTLEEAERNIREVIEGHIAVMREHGESVPVPTTAVQEVAVEIPA